MGQLTLEAHAGGGVYLTPSANQTLVWWWNRRQQTIKPTVGGLTMTLQSSGAYPCMPEGGPAFVLVNPEDSSFSWTLRDLVSSFTMTVGIGECAEVYRVHNGSGGRKWWATLWPLI